MASDCSIGQCRSIKTCPQFCLWSHSNSNLSFITTWYELSEAQLDAASVVCWSRLVLATQACPSARELGLLIIA